MGLSDRKRRTNYSKAGTMFHRCRGGLPSLRGHAVHKGIMEFNPVELAIWSKLVQELRWVPVVGFGWHI